MIKHPAFDRGNIYLSGGMEKAVDLGSAWRLTVSEHLRRMKYFPLDITEMDKAYTSRFGQLYHYSNEVSLLQFKSNVRRQFIFTDLQLILNDSDALIVYYDDSVRRGAGTISECQVAYNADIPLFLVSAYPSLDEIPGWLKALSTRIFTKFEDLFVYLERLPYGILARDIYGNRHSGSHYLCSLCGEPFEKSGSHYVSKVSPLYCKHCVDMVKRTFEKHKDRYQFFLEYMTAESAAEK